MYRIKESKKNLNRLFLFFGSANLLMCLRAWRTEEFVKGYDVRPNNEKRERTNNSHLEMEKR